jgi:hypothetical protein
VSKFTKKLFIPKISVADPDPEGSETFGRIRIRFGTEINVSDPKLDPKKICKNEHYFLAEISWFHMIIHISVTVWYGSESGDPCLLLMDPNPKPANLLRTLFIAK